MQLNQIGEKGINESLVRRFTTGGPAVAPTLAPEVMPVYVIENDRPEVAWLKGERLFGASGTVAAGAAAVSSVQLINPDASRMIVTVTAIECLPASQFPIMRVINVGPVLPFGTSARGGTRDGRMIRNGALGLSSSIIITDNTLGNPAATPWGRLTGVPWQCFEPVVLDPGKALYISPSVNNVAITGFSLQWRERYAEPGELV